jgi:hypothetical protein
MSQCESTLEVMAMIHRCELELGHAGEHRSELRHCTLCWIDETLSEAGSSAAVVDTALPADESSPSGAASGTAVTSETVGERQGWRPASLSAEPRRSVA